MLVGQNPADVLQRIGTRYNGKPITEENRAALEFEYNQAIGYMFDLGSIARRLDYMIIMAPKAGGFQAFPKPDNLAGAKRILRILRESCPDDSAVILGQLQERFPAFEWNWTGVRTNFAR